MFIAIRLNVTASSVGATYLKRGLVAPPRKYIPLLRSSRNILSGGTINISSLRDCAEEKSCSKNKKLDFCCAENAEIAQGKDHMHPKPQRIRINQISKEIIAAEIAVHRASSAFSASLR